MSYTNTWSDTRPLGSAQASTADDEMRTIRQDIHERMDSITEGWSNDPVVLDSTKVGAKEDKKLLVPFTEFMLDASEQNADAYQSNHLGSSSVAGSALASLMLPVGVSIKKLEWLVDNGDTLGLTVKLRSISFDSSASITDEFSTTDNVAGVHTIDSGDVGITIGEDKYYLLFIDKDSGTGYSIYAVRITYSTPNVLATR